MASVMEQTMHAFLLETEELTERVNELPYVTAVELYDLLDVSAKSVTANIRNVNAQLRVEICARQDALLERIVDLQKMTGGGYSIPDRSQGVYTPAVHDYRRWTNTELLKDKCLTGYTLAKTVGAKPVQYFCDGAADNSYARELPGLEILYTDEPAGTPHAYEAHLQKEYRQMDALILHGMYGKTIDFLDAYRKRRPDGRVYCGLDMNSYWMARIPWEHPAVQRFARQCDVVATSCSSLRDALNMNPNVGFPCRWMPNGFYNAGNLAVEADADRKENVILTVGRIGTAQKNNEELLRAFARVSARLPGWTVRLVGPIEPGFQPFINDYFTKHPDLVGRVVFTGAIVDKKELFAEYARARVFALTSQSEGFPNVYAEALVHGCMFVTSDIDAASDITCDETLGITYPLGDGGALERALLTLSQITDRARVRTHIENALAYARRYFDWNRNAEKLAYMLYRNCWAG